jgi:hypothetical protein
MSHTIRSNPFLRRREYRASLKQWDEKYDSVRRRDESTGEDMYGRLPRVYIVENSNSNLEGMLDAHGTHGTHINTISTHDKHANDHRGKGVSEYRSIKYAVDTLLKEECGRVVKVTGRYYVPGLIDEILAFEGASSDNAQPKVIIQSTPSEWNMWEEDGGVVRSEIVSFDPSLVDFLFDGQDESIGLPMERILRIRTRQLEEESPGSVKMFGEMRIEETRNAEAKVVQML